MDGDPFGQVSVSRGGSSRGVDRGVERTDGALRGPTRPRAVAPRVGGHRPPRSVGAGGAARTDVLIAFLNESEEASQVKKLVEKEGRKAVLVAGDLQDAEHCREVIKKAVDDLGGIDILVNNAAHQATFKEIGDISDEEWEKTF